MVQMVTPLNTNIMQFWFVCLFLFYSYYSGNAIASVPTISTARPK